MMKSILVTFLLILSVTAGVFAQFEGVIEFEEHKHGHINKYAFYVKGDHVRIEELDDKGQVVGVELINLHTERAIALNVQRKIYLDASSNTPLPVANIETVEEDVTKKILDWECEEVVVTDKTNGAKAVYWMAKGDFSFFADLIRILNRKDPISLYLQQSGIDKGQFAIESTYYKPDGTEGVKLVTTSVVMMDLKQSLFEIPKGYTELNN